MIFAFFYYQNEKNLMGKHSTLNTALHFSEGLGDVLTEPPSLSFIRAQYRTRYFILPTCSCRSLKFLWIGGAWLLGLESRFFLLSQTLALQNMTQ